MRAREARRQVEQYRARLNREVTAARERSAALQREHRRAQYAAQQQYLANLRSEQQRLRGFREREYYSRILAPYTYRYRWEGRYYETNVYGADMLRQAVRFGYEEGFRAGRADRFDGAPFDYRDNYAYLDANYGYDGLYISEIDYNYYFRAGFRRGYEDGYYGRYRYGVLEDGVPAILGTVLVGILGLVPIG